MNFAYSQYVTTIILHKYYSFVVNQNLWMAVLAALCAYICSAPRGREDPLGNWTTPTNMTGFSQLTKTVLQAKQECHWSLLLAT